MAEWIRYVVASIFIIGGVSIAGIATFGVFRFKNALNRMHAAAMIDTLAILLALVGLMFLGDVFSTTQETIFFILKLVLVIVFLWFASPVASHLISRLEVTTNENLEEECEVEK
ncbi:Na(+) H(+) antiporter subunit G [Lachnospiraceae bacterium KM106-2]|nr:Na(+) H(+) antiporter subunit G [Lachnospiraceae bacterium KM106-2]